MWNERSREGEASGERMREDGCLFVMEHACTPANTAVPKQTDTGTQKTHHGNDDIKGVLANVFLVGKVRQRLVCAHGRMLRNGRKTADAAANEAGGEGSSTARRHAQTQMWCTTYPAAGGTTFM